MSDSTDWVMSDLRRTLLETAAGDEAGAIPETLSAPTRDSLNLLVDYVLGYDESAPDMPDDVTDTYMYDWLVTRLESQLVWDASREGHVPRMRGVAGRHGENNHVQMADWNTYEQLKDLFRQEPQYNTEFTNNIFQCIIFSSCIPPTGRGKSNTMYTLTEIAETVHPDLRVMSNNTSDPYETVSEQWADIEASIRDHDGWQILLIDEAAQFLQYADQGAGKTVSQMLKLLRHNHCHLILVGHTGRDIPADIRRQVFVLDKLSQKTGKLGYGITSTPGSDTMQVGEEVLRLKKIPATNVDYDDIDDEGIEIKFDKDREDGEEELVEQAPQCQAETNNGTRCPNDAKHPSDGPVVCVNHRHKMDDIDVDGEGDESE